jgi:hypothetical protein
VVPKFGFQHYQPVEYLAINLSTLKEWRRRPVGRYVKTRIGRRMGFTKVKDKILANGTLTLKLVVKAPTSSKSAQEAIEKLEGTTEKRLKLMKKLIDTLSIFIRSKTCGPGWESRCFPSGFSFGITLLLPD